MLSVDMIRRLPDGFPLLLRGSHAPVIVAVAKGWKHAEYRRLRRRGLHVVVSTEETDESLATPALGEINVEPGLETNGRPSWPAAPAATSYSGTYLGDGTAWWAEQ